MRSRFLIMQRLALSLTYRLLSSCAAVLALPLLPWLVARSKYRTRLLPRLGWGLAKQLGKLPPVPGPTLWLHALSVGEITSALPLVRGLRDRFPQARLIVSATTRAGAQVAAKLLGPSIDALIAAPLDLGPVIPWYLKTIKPDLFIQVETDFWPHWLHCLAASNIPALLVNGRISEGSFRRYRRFAPILAPMFSSFTCLSMQTAADASRMAGLGVAPQVIRTLGNLKFDTGLVRPTGVEPTAVRDQKIACGFAADAPLWICGSTHRGEEAILLRTYARLRERFPTLQLLIAPRAIDRAQEIKSLAREEGMEARLRQGERSGQGPVLILNTIGELAGCYPMARLVFIGGSLVPRGGHNPIEPAAAGVPVLFGPHMEDFSEIADDLSRSGGARQITDEADLTGSLNQLLADPEQSRAMALAARSFVECNTGVVEHHLAVIDHLLARRPPPG